MPTDEEIAEWEQLALLASDGPWKWNDDEDELHSKTEPILTGNVYCVVEVAKRDVKFIAAARDAVPALVDEVRRLKNELQTATNDMKAGSSYIIGKRDDVITILNTEVARLTEMLVSAAAEIEVFCPPTPYQVELIKTVRTTVRDF